MDSSDKEDKKSNGDKNDNPDPKKITENQPPDKTFTK